MIFSDSHSKQLARLLDAAPTKENILCWYSKLNNSLISIQRHRHEAFSDLFGVVLIINQSINMDAFIKHLQSRTETFVCLHLGSVQVEDGDAVRLFSQVPTIDTPGSQWACLLFLPSSRRTGRFGQIWFRTMCCVQVVLSFPEGKQMRWDWCGCRESGLKWMGSAWLVWSSSSVYQGYIRNGGASREIGLLENTWILRLHQ